MITSLSNTLTIDDVADGSGWFARLRRLLHRSELPAVSHESDSFAGPDFLRLEPGLLQEVRVAARH